MRKAKTIKREVNLLKPVVIPELVPDDCFGTSFYDPRDKDCSICADCDYCGIVREQAIRKLKQKLNKEQGSYLDEVDFASVDWKKIEQKAKEYEDSGEPMTYAELTDAISTIARIKDQIAVDEFIKRSLPQTTIHIVNGYIYAKRENSSSQGPNTA